MPAQSSTNVDAPHALSASFISGRGETERLAKTNESLQRRNGILEVRLRAKNLIAAQSLREGGSAGGSRAHGDPIASIVGILSV